MLEVRPSNAAPLLVDAAQFSGSIREGILLGLVLFTLVRSGEALAGDQATIPNATSDSGVGNLRKPSPSTFASPAAPGDFAVLPADGIQAFSTTEFRPRRHAAFDSNAAVSAFSDAPMLHSTTVWQRMSEYKSQNRVRLLTLWESSGSTVSLQAGRRGDPSLQWTSRLMNRGGSTRGLLDRLFSVSFAGASTGFRDASRSTHASALSKPVGAGTPAAASLK
jgi:hypothetical protein